MVYIIFIIMFLGGILMVVNPKLAWELEHFFSVKGGEPTDFYLVTTRISGGIIIIFLLYLLYSEII